VNSSSVQSVETSSPTLVSSHVLSTRSVPRVSRRTQPSSQVEGQCHVLYVGRPSPCHLVGSTTSRSTPLSPAYWIYATSSPPHSHKVKVKVKVRPWLPLVLTNNINSACVWVCVCNVEIQIRVESHIGFYKIIKTLKLLRYTAWYKVTSSFAKWKLVWICRRQNRLTVGLFNPSEVMSNVMNL